MLTTRMAGDGTRAPAPAGLGSRRRRGRLILQKVFPRARSRTRPCRATDLWLKSLFFFFFFLHLYNAMCYNIIVIVAEICIKKSNLSKWYQPGS